jgi:hypothetical protein
MENLGIVLSGKLDDIFFGEKKIAETKSLTDAEFFGIAFLFCQNGFPQGFQ